MVRYVAFLIVGCAFMVGLVAMVKTHLHVPNPSGPQIVVASQGIH